LLAMIERVVLNCGRAPGQERVNDPPCDLAGSVTLESAFPQAQMEVLT
jgi:hypothetical protein